MQTVSSLITRMNGHYVIAWNRLLFSATPERQHQLRKSLSKSALLQTGTPASRQSPARRTPPMQFPMQEAGYAALLPGLSLQTVPHTACQQANKLCRQDLLRQARHRSRPFNKHTHYGKSQHSNSQSDTCHSLNPGIKHPGKCSRKQQQNQIFKSCLHGHNVLFRTNSQDSKSIGAYMNLPKFIEKYNMASLQQRHTNKAPCLKYIMELGIYVN